jgi:ATP-GRASP peptide maturase of grasp-with-spasm system
VILIISAENDSSSDEICKWLLHLKKPFIRINESNPIVNIKIDLNDCIYEFTLKKSGCINLNQVVSIFYRNGDIGYEFRAVGTVSDFLKKFYDDEWVAVKNFIKNKFNHNQIKVIGNLFNNRVNKLEVLSVAKKLNLLIPKSFIVSNKNDFLAFTALHHSKWITKSISEMSPLIKNGDLYLNYTKQISKEQIADEYFIPTIIQEKIEKKYEIRTFFIFNKFWSISIFSQENESTETDYRAYDFENTNHIMPFKIPLYLEKKILKLAKELNLNSGSVDWIYSKKNKFYFLEINPLGIFNNVSVVANFQIEKTIAEYL